MNAYRSVLVLHLIDDFYSLPYTNEAMLRSRLSRLLCHDLAYASGNYDVQRVLELVAHTSAGESELLVMDREGDVVYDALSRLLCECVAVSIVSLVLAYNGSEALVMLFHAVLLSGYLAKLQTFEQRSRNRDYANYSLAQVV